MAAFARMLREVLDEAVTDDGSAKAVEVPGDRVDRFRVGKARPHGRSGRYGGRGHADLPQGRGRIGRWIHNFDRDIRDSGRRRALAGL